MESQFRRGILDACVLAVLEQGESYGYQMVKDINEFITITESTLYPILKRLENAKMLTVFTQEHNGRLTISDSPEKGARFLMDLPFIEKEPVQE